MLTYESPWECSIHKKSYVIFLWKISKNLFLFYKLSVTKVSRKDIGKALKRPSDLASSEMIRHLSMRYSKKVLRIIYQH